MKNSKTKLVALILMIPCMILIFGCKKSQAPDIQNVRSNPVVSKADLAKQISESKDFITFFKNLTTIKNLAVTTHYPNSYLNEKDPMKSEFIKNIYKINSKDKNGVADALNSQFSKGNEMADLLSANLDISNRIKKTFPQLLSLSAKDQDEVAIMAIKNLVSPNTAISTELQKPLSCRESCELQYDISAGACALLVETIFGAVVCFIAANAGLAACNAGCPEQQ